ncbi:MAG TPA: DnaJ C-terminal domain-containing protein, partial [Bacteroidia bacterium]|nr:DnaJ C-terminal domain-containing protein [Bacteroidia bacterium]
KIKPGAFEGQVLRLKGKGGPGAGGGPSGDVLITTHILPHPQFTLKGHHVYGKIPVDLYTALLGGKAKVRSLKGLINMDIPAGTANGAVLRLKGMGMPFSGGYGDFYGEVSVTLPDNLSEPELKLFRELRELSEKKTGNK